MSQGDVGIPTGIQEVVSALTAGQNAGRLPHLSPGTAVDALIKALTLDGLGVSCACGYQWLHIAEPSVIIIPFIL